MLKITNLKLNEIRFEQSNHLSFEVQQTIYGGVWIPPEIRKERYEMLKEKYGDLARYFVFPGNFGTWGNPFLK